MAGAGGGVPRSPAAARGGRAGARGGSPSAANPGLAAPSPLPGAEPRRRLPAARRWQRCGRGEARVAERRREAREERRGEAGRAGGGGPMASMACEVMPLQRYVPGRGSPRPKTLRGQAGRGACAGLPGPEARGEPGLRPCREEQRSSAPLRAGCPGAGAVWQVD